MERSRLTEILNGMKNVRVAMFGDYYIDKWLYIDRDLDELSLETSITAYQVVDKNVQPGAAGTVLNSFCSLGVGTIHAVGVIGDDGEGYELRSLLQKMHVDASMLVTCDHWSTPTYIKPTFRYENGMQESNRLDVHNRTALSDNDEKQLIQHLYDVSEDVDALVVSDQRRHPSDNGVITPGIVSALSDIAVSNPDLCVYVDSRAAIGSYSNLTLKCNHMEALQAVYQDREREIDADTIKYCAEVLRKNTGRDVIITWGENGAGVLSGEKFVLVPAVKVSGPIDVTGAGDSMTAGLISAYCAGADIFESVLIGNLAASVTIQQIGKTGTASAQDILNISQSRG